MEIVNTTTRPIPNKFVEGAASPSTRKAIATMNRDLWVDCMSEGQRKLGMTPKDKAALYVHLAQEWCLRFPIERVSFLE